VREREREREKKKRGREAKVQGNKGLCVNCKLIQIHSKPTTHKNRARSRSKQSKKPSKHGMEGKSGVKKNIK